MTSAPITTASAALSAMLAGNATLTLVSKKTGSRYTFNVKAPREEDGTRSEGTRFVSLLTGPNNETDYSYIGMIRRDGRGFRTTAKTAAPESAPVKGFGWAFEALRNGRLPETLEIWHEGRCCRCGRKLTTPASIELGIGPDCAEAMGA
jgi:hypothetical protein